MLTNFLLGLPTMVLCLMLQIVFLVVVINYIYNHSDILDSVSIWYNP